MPPVPPSAGPGATPIDTMEAMERDEIMATLRASLPELQREFGVRSLALFGSAARGDARPGSDTDILVDFEPDALVTLFTLARLLRRLEALIGSSVDLVENHPGLSDSFRASISKDLCRVA